MNIKSWVSSWFAAICAGVLMSSASAADSPRGLLELLRSALAPDQSKKQDEAIEIARRAVGEHPSPRTWDSAVYLPYATPNELLSQFIGTAIVTDIKGLANVSLTLTTFKITGGWGEARVELGLHAGTSLTKDSADLTVEGKLLYRGYTEKTSGTASAVFGVVLDTPRAAANVNGKTLTAPDWLTSVAASSAMRLFEDRLTFAIPVTTDYSRRVGYNGETTLKAGDAGTVTVRITAPGTTLHEKIERFAPVLVRSGMWLCVRFEGSPAPKSGVVPTKLEEALAEYESESGPTPKLFVNGNFLEGVVNGLGELSETARTAKAKIVSHRDRLLNTGGDIHAKVWLENDDGGGSLTVTPSADWKVDENDSNKHHALTIAATYASAVSANLHVHVDVGPGGGAGTSVGTRGNSSGKVEGTMKTLLLSDKPDPKAPGKVLVLRADFPKQELKAEVKTDGRLKLKILGGWESIRVPQFGTRVTLPVPYNVVPSIPLLSDAPYPIDFAASETLPEGVAIVPAEGKKIPTHLVVEPGEPIRDPLGYVLPFTVQILALTDEEANQRAAATRAVLLRESRPTIELGKVEVLLAGVAFGPNNDLIKSVRNTYETLDKAQRDFVNETEKVAERVGDTVNDAANRLLKNWDLPKRPIGVRSA